MDIDKEDAFNVVTALCNIEKQLKRIADRLDENTVEGNCFATFESNSNMSK